MQSKNKNLIVLGLLAFGIVMRVLPYVLRNLGFVSLTDRTSYIWNVSPVAAMCLLGGAYVSSRWIGFGVGFAAYLLSDLLIGWVSGQPQFAFYSELPFVYAGFILHGLIGMTLRGRPSRLRIGLTAVASELVFFMVSNFGVWAIGDMNYVKTPSGLLACYVAALPFLYRSLYGTLIYSAVFFELASVLERQPGDKELAYAPVPSSDVRS